VRSSGLNCLPVLRVLTFIGQIIAIIYAPDGRLVVQSREPAALFVASSTRTDDGSTPTTQIGLAGVSVFDTGHEIFHRDAGAGVACASCHFEGGDDGHVWRFADQGPRRTQSIDVGLEGTAPFHWVGDMKDIGTLMEQVFVGRMGGVHQSDARRLALEQWMYSIKAPTPLRVADEVSARGKVLFEGQAKCAACHVGSKLTNNETVDVGKGLLLQVPSLIGIGHRAPFMHDGCAATLYDRFNPACGGSAHGNTASLSRPQIDDLVAYLQTL
jgi:cytochrome c